MNNREPINHKEELLKTFDENDKAEAAKKAVKSKKEKSIKKETENEKTEKKENIHKDHRKRLDKKVELGLEYLAVHEQLEWILFAIIPTKDTNRIAHELLNRFGTLQGVFNASEKDLKKIAGVGHRTAMFLRQVNSIAGIALRSWQSNVPIDTDERMVNYVKSYFIGKDVECSYMFMLDAGRRVKSVVKLSEGINDETHIYFQSVAKNAAMQNAKMVIIAHNHPAGTMEASQADRQVISSIEVALNSVGVKLLDSIIVTENGCYSMKTQGMMINLVIK